MPVPYTDFRYFYPPRPSTRVKFQSPIYNKFKEAGSWLAQYKLNGQRNMIYISPDRKVDMWNRHKERHRNYSPSPKLIEQLLASLDLPDGWAVLDSELLHNKDKSVKHTIYIYDVLVAGGQQLIGETYLQRYNQLMSIVRPSETRQLYTELQSNNIWLANNITPAGWDEGWAHTLALPWVEGYVLKRVNQPLYPGIAVENNGGWLVRCRKSDG